MEQYDIFLKYNLKFLYNEYLIDDHSSKHLSIMVTEIETIWLTLSSSDRCRYI